jgi:hypothetical protein
MGSISPNVFSGEEGFQDFAAIADITMKAPVPINSKIRLPPRS